MDENLKWMFTLLDEVSNPAGKIFSSLKSINVAMGDGKSFTAAFGDTLKGTSPSLFSFGAAIGGWASVASTVGGFIGRLGEVVFDVGKTAAVAGFEFAEFAVNALAFKESTLASFELILGTKKAALDIFKTAADYARITPFQTKEVVTGFKQLLGAGFSKGEAAIAFQGIGDVAAAAGFDPTVVPRLTLAFAQIRAAGHLMGQDLHQILNATGAAGIGLGDIYAKMAKNMGVSVDQVAQLQAQGAIDSKTAIFSIFEAIKAKTGELGAVMEKQGTTITGLFSTLQSAPSDFFLAMDLDHLPGLITFKGFLQNLVALFDTNSKSGRQLLGFLTEIVNDLGGLFKNLTGREGLARMEDMLTTVIFWLREFWHWGMAIKDAMGELWDATEPLREVFSDVFGKGGLDQYRGEIYLLTLAIRALADGLRGLGTMASVGLGITEAISSGGSVADGFSMGLLRATPGGLDAIDELALGSVNRMKKHLQVQSPSAVFEDIGLDTAEGYTQGLEGGLSGVAGAIGALAGLRPGGGEGGAGAGARTVSVSVPITITVPPGSGEELVRQLQALLPSALAETFERLAIEAGMAEAPA